MHPTLAFSACWSQHWKDDAILANSLIFIACLTLACIVSEFEKMYVRPESNNHSKENEVNLSDKTSHFS